MSLYKYTTSEVAEFILKTKKVRITQPIAFNDPYDTYPKLNNLFPDEVLKDFYSKILADENIVNQVLDEAVTKEYSKLSPWLKSFFSTFPIRKWFNHEAIKRYGSIQNAFMEKMDFNSLKQIIVNHFLSLISSYIGILCFSKINNNLLMWSHYSDSHRGIVLEFDESHPFFRQIDNPSITSIIEIDYTDKRPEIVFDKFELTLEESLEYAKKIFFTKAVQWSYEEEFRLVKPIIGKEKLGNLDRNGFDIFVMDFPEECLTGMIFGSKMKKEKCDQFISIKKDSEFENISFRQAFLDPDKYIIQIANL